MTQLAHQPLQRLKDRLAELVAEGDATHLAELLRGRDLPALGGDQAPADLLLQALNLHPFDSHLVHGVATLTGQVLAEHATRMTSEAAQNEQVWGYGPQTLVYNGLLLACDLPANETLFAAVKRWHQLLVDRGLEASEYPQLATIGRHALIHQQTDDSLESYWLALIDRVGSAAHEEEGQEGLTSEERTLLLDAWRGLLWIPPDEQQREDRAVISFDRLNRGLMDLESALTERVEQDEAANFLSRAFRLLQQTYPRSSSFWGEKWRPFWRGWSESLHEAARELWPAQEHGLEHVAPAIRKRVRRPEAPEAGPPFGENRERAGKKPIPADKVFKALSDVTRQEILQILRAHECTVRELLGRTNVSQPTLSRHLAVLKEVDLVIDQRKGPDVIYQLTGDVLSFSIWQLLGRSPNLEESDESEELAAGA